MIMVMTFMTDRADLSFKSFMNCQHKITYRNPVHKETGAVWKN